MQIFYTFSAYFMAGHPSKVSNSAAFVILLFGLISIVLNYGSDAQKEAFKMSGGRCEIWLRPAKFMVTSTVHYLFPIGYITTTLHYLFPIGYITTTLHYLLPIGYITTTLHYLFPIDHATPSIHYFLSIGNSTLAVHYLLPICKATNTVDYMLPIC